jgi:hypothetical protein
MDEFKIRRKTLGKQRQWVFVQVLPGLSSPSSDSPQ